MFLLAVVVLLLISVLLPVLGLVPLKMLPFDNKNDFLVVANLPNEAPLVVTEEALQDLGRYLTTVNEVDSVVTYGGVSAPIDFNGLVRHYYLTQGTYVGQIRVNLAAKERRRAGSHAIALWVRPALEKIALRHQHPPGHRRSAARAAGFANPGGRGLWPARGGLYRPEARGGQH